jgi:hypothetical protein
METMTWKPSLALTAAMTAGLSAQTTFGEGSYGNMSHSMEAERHRQELMRINQNYMRAMRNIAINEQAMGNQPAPLDWERQYPPLTVTSGPGRRLWPQQVVKGLEDKDGSVREFEAVLNRALDEAERLMRSQPSSLPPNHLATALAREAGVLFMVTLGYRSTSEEVSQEHY